MICWLSLKKCQIQVLCAIFSKLKTVLCSKTVCTLETPPFPSSSSHPPSSCGPLVRVRGLTPGNEARGLIGRRHDQETRAGCQGQRLTSVPSDKINSLPVAAANTYHSVYTSPLILAIHLS